MKKRIALFSPGPTNLSKVVLDSFQSELIHHRGKQFQALYPSLCEKLKNIFKTTKGETLILTGSGTLGLDAGIASLLCPKDKVIVLSNGYFGERLAMMCKKYGLEVIELSYPWTKVIPLIEVEQALNQHTDIKALFVVHSETSTGNLQDIRALGELTHQRNILLMVDAISGLLFNDFEFDDWHVDYAVSSSQKGFGLPPGLAFVCMSPKAILQLKNQDINYYISLKDNLEFKKTYASTPSTPAIHMLQAFDVASDEILSKGIISYKERGQALVHKMKTRLMPLGFKPLVSEESQVFGVLGMYVPTGIRSDHLQEYLLTHHQVYIERGIAKMANQMIRIGLMSDVSDAEVEALLSGIEVYIHEFIH